MGKSSHGVRATRGLAANEASSTKIAARMHAQANNSAPPVFLLGRHAAFLALLGRYLRRRARPLVDHVDPARAPGLGRDRGIPRPRRSRRFRALAGRAPGPRRAPRRVVAAARAAAG